MALWLKVQGTLVTQKNWRASPSMQECIVSSAQMLASAALKGASECVTKTTTE